MSDSSKTADKKSSVRSRDRPTDDDLEDALRATKGIYVAAVGWLKKERGKRIGRDAFSRRVNKSERLHAVRNEVIDSTLDWAETQLFRLISEGNPTAIIFYLKCKGKHRGYSERSEVTGANGAPLTPGPIQVEFVSATKRDEK